MIPQCPIRVILSAAVSIDGFRDDCSQTRLILSGVEDLQAVDALRSECDAILVGAETIRRDNPSLSVKSAELREKRSAGLMKVIVTSSGDLNPSSRVFQESSGSVVVFCPEERSEMLSRSLGDTACVRSFPGRAADPLSVLKELESIGVTKLLIEGGEKVHTCFISAGLFDEIRLAIGPFFVGDPAAPRFVEPACFPFNSECRMKLLKVEKLGDMAVLSYVR